MFQISSCEPNLDTLPNVLDSIRQHRLCIIIVPRSTVSQSRHKKIGINTDGHCSHPCLIIFLAATILPACSSKQAAAIQPGACFGLLHQRIKQCSRWLDIANFGIRLYDDVFERGEVAFRVDGCRSTRRCRCAGNLRNNEEHKLTVDFWQRTWSSLRDTSILSRA